MGSYKLTSIMSGSSSSSSSPTSTNSQASLWKSFFGHLEQQKQILQWMKGEDDAKLEEEYKLLKKSISSTGAKKSQQASSTSENKRKRKRMEGGGGSGATSSKTAPEDYVEILDGDDVPLVEEVVEEMLDDEGNDALEVNGDNFMHTVMKMNKAQEIITNGKTEPKKSTSNKKKKIVENGIGIIHVDEEMVKSKRNKKMKVKKEAKKESGSVEDGQKCFEWMIDPITKDNFFKDTWEKKPLHIKRNGNQQYYKHIFSTKSFDEILRSQNVQYTKNLDVTSYSDGKRATHNPEGRAYAPVVWDFYNNGCSLRMLNPQTFHDSVWKLCATLQEFMGSFVGTNMYLTPPGTQGFAPHYDDVEVFILQLEGKKRWRVYKPKSDKETLPKFSSRNFEQSEIGKPMMDMVLQPGDLLYMPRGTIHQGNCLEDAHSLHITVSCHQLNTYGDLLEKLLPAAIKAAQEQDIAFRQGLPTNYLSNLGVAYEENEENPEHNRFMSKVQSLMGKLFEYAPVDSAVDQMGKRFTHTALPPYLSSQESNRCVITGGERWNSSKNRVVNRVEIDPDTEIRMIRAQCLRLVTEEDNQIRIYYCVENTREYEEVDLQSLEVDAEAAPGIQALIQSYPNYIKVEDLPIQELDLKMKVVQDLWEKKLLLTKNPLEAHYDD